MTIIILGAILVVNCFIAGYLCEIKKSLSEANRLKKLGLQYKDKETIPISEIHQI